LEVVASLSFTTTQGGTSGSFTDVPAETTAIPATRVSSTDTGTDENNELDLELDQDDEGKGGKRKVALLIIDVQNDFCPECSLAVKDGL